MFKSLSRRIDRRQRCLGLKNSCSNVPNPDLTMLCTFCTVRLKRIRTHNLKDTEALFGVCLIRSSTASRFVMPIDGL